MTVGDGWPKQDEQPARCPTCGGVPKLREQWWYPGGSSSLLVTRWYECRRWFGLRLCRRGPEHTNEKGWADLAQRCAAQKWNAEVVEIVEAELDKIKDEVNRG